MAAAAAAVRAYGDSPTELVSEHKVKAERTSSDATTMVVDYDAEVNVKPEPEVGSKRHVEAEIADEADKRIKSEAQDPDDEDEEGEEDSVTCESCSQCLDEEDQNGSTDADDDDTEAKEQKEAVNTRAVAYAHVNLDPEFSIPWDQVDSAEKKWAQHVALTLRSPIPPKPLPPALEYATLTSSYLASDLINEPFTGDASDEAHCADLLRDDACLPLPNKKNPTRQLQYIDALIWRAYTLHHTQIAVPDRVHPDVIQALKNAGFRLFRATYTEHDGRKKSELNITFLDKPEPQDVMNYHRVQWWILCVEDFTLAHRVLTSDV